MFNSEKSNIEIQKKLRQKQKQTLKISHLPNKQGYIHIHVQEVELQEQDNCKEFYLVLYLNNEKRESDRFTMQEDVLEVQDGFIFQANAQCNLKIQLYNADKFDIIGFTQFPIKKLFNMPKIRHFIQADLARQMPQTQKGVKQYAKVANISLYLLHLNEKIGILQVGTIQANVTRNTQSLGKMDLFLVIIVNDQQYKTPVKKEAGLRAIWNTKFSIPVLSVYTEMRLIVYDQDRIQDDLVGQVRFNLMKRNFLFPSIKNNKQVINIQYEGKKAGVVCIESKFVLNQL